MKKAIIVSASFVLPYVAFAQASFAGLTTLAQSFRTFLGVIFPIVFAIAMIYFFWGVAKYILSAGDPKSAAEGKSIMIYGIIAIAVMASVYGLVNFLQTTLGISGGTVTLPPLP
ncbi:MAG TPA: hypothetical protein PLZ99_02495 [Parcubacteria group bacterium]|jgi:small-conductance mechanosensitive channel|nr:hypothetical protein [Parcubacteria group bacterium]